MGWLGERVVEFEALGLLRTFRRRESWHELLKLVELLEVVVVPG